MHYAPCCLIIVMAIRTAFLRRQYHNAPHPLLDGGLRVESSRPQEAFCYGDSQSFVPAEFALLSTLSKLLHYRAAVRFLLVSARSAKSAVQSPCDRMKTNRPVLGHSKKSGEAARLPDAGFSGGDDFACIANREIVLGLVLMSLGRDADCDTINCWIGKDFIQCN